MSVTLKNMGKGLYRSADGRWAVLKLERNRWEVVRKPEEAPAPKAPFGTLRAARIFIDRFDKWPPRVEPLQHETAFRVLADGFRAMFPTAESVSVVGNTLRESRLVVTFDVGRYFREKDDALDT